jgi:hypothetical protein
MRVFRKSNRKSGGNSSIRDYEINSGLLTFSYHPQPVEKSLGRSQGPKKLSNVQIRLENFKRDPLKDV